MLQSRRGNSLVEFSLLLPWYVFLFIGIFDFGFYSYALIATETAVRVAGEYCASSTTAAADSTTACGYVLDQLRGLPNVGMNLASCAASPVVVTTSLVSGSSTPDGANAANVVVSYTTPRLIPIPGILAGQITISRTVLMKTRS